MTARGRAVWLLAAGLLAGCALRRPARELRPATAEELLGGLAARRSAVTSLRARAHVRSRLATVGTRQAVLVRRPDAVRIDVLHPFGLVLAVGAKDGRLWAYRPSEATCYQSPATTENVSRLLGAPVALPDVVDVLLGLPPARTPTGKPMLASAGAEYRLTVPFAGGVQTIRFAGDPLNVVGAEEVRADGTLLRVAFGDHQDGFPHSIDILTPATGEEVKLALDAVEPNATLDPALFAPPPALHVLPLTAALEGE